MAEFNAGQLKALNRIGNAYLGGNAEFPSFSKLQCANQYRRVVDFLPPQDLADLKLLLTLFSILPQFIVNFKIRMLEFLWLSGFPLPGILRQMRLGLRGIVFSLYYSMPEIEKLIGYQVSVYTQDLNPSVK